MNGKAEKVYGEAFFEIGEELGSDSMKNILEELTALSKVFDENPEFTKVMMTPTIPLNEKLDILKEIIKKGNVSEMTGNLLCLLVEKNRMNCFKGIVKEYREQYNIYFKLADITVTTPEPLSKKMREQIIKKMSQVIGSDVTLTEKIDKSLIGGIIIDYGCRRYDGSVKSRLNALSQELGSVIN